MNKKILILILFSVLLMNTKNTTGTIYDYYFTHDDMSNKTTLESFTKWNTTLALMNTTKNYYFEPEWIGSYGYVIAEDIDNLTVTYNEARGYVLRFNWTSGSTMYFGLGNTTQNSFGINEWAIRYQFDTSGIFCSDSRADALICYNKKPVGDRDQNNILEIKLLFNSSSSRVYFKNASSYNAAFSDVGWVEYAYTNWTNAELNSTIRILPFRPAGKLLELYDIWLLHNYTNKPIYYINLSGFDNFNNNTLLNLTINADGTLYQTKNGSILLDYYTLVNTVYSDVMIDSGDNDGYFTQHLYNVNLSRLNDALFFNLTNARINLSVNFNNASLPIFQVYYNTSNVSTINGSADFNFTKGSADLKVSFDGLAYSTYSYSQAIPGNKTTFINISMETGFGSCSGAGGNQIMFFRVFEENRSSIPINSTVEYFMDFGNFTVIGNFSGEPDNYTICNNASVGTLLTGNVYVKHYPKDNSGFVHRWYGYNLSLGNYSYNITLYNYNDTSGVSNLKINLRNAQNYFYYPNVLTKLQRYYVSEGTWREVQHSLSDDYGLVDFDIIERSVDYRLYFYDTNNNLIQNTTSLKFVCSSMLCELTYLLSPVSTSPSMPDVSVSFVYDNSTDFIHLNWTDTEGRTRTVSTVIKSMSGISDTIICNISQVGTGGNVSCNISGYSGDIHTDVYVIGSLYSIFSRIITVVGGFFSGLSEWKPAEGAFWSMFIMVPIVLSAVFSPVAVIVSSIVGLIAIKSLHLLSVVTTAFIGVAALIGIVISLRMRR